MRRFTIIELLLLVIFVPLSIAVAVDLVLPVIRGGEASPPELKEKMFDLIEAIVIAMISSATTMIGMMLYGKKGKDDAATPNTGS